LIKHDSKRAKTAREPPPRLELLAGDSSAAAREQPQDDTQNDEAHQAIRT
jgi:hypothetical protein